MRFTETVILDKPIDAVWAAFDNIDNLPKWQPTLTKVEHKSGDLGQPGSVVELTYREGKRDMVLTETVTERDYPHRFQGTYTVGDTVNHVCNRFEDLGDGRTRWDIECEFKFGGVFGLIAPLMKGAFVKRTRADIERFASKLSSGEIA